METYDMQLISQVEQHPELYDYTHRHFKNKKFKNEIWRQIAYHMRHECDDDSVKLVKIRWKSLRDSFVKETKHRAALTGGECIKPKKNWRYSKSMEFLTPFLHQSNTWTRGVRRSFNSGHDSTSKEYDDIEPVSKLLITPEDLKRVTQEGCSEHFLGEMLNYDTNSADLDTPSEDGENDIDSFFKALADTVKKLTPVNQVKIQKDIVNMVLDVKLQEAQEKRDTLDTI